jgi:hypothetical protein
MCLGRNIPRGLGEGVFEPSEMLFEELTLVTGLLWPATKILWLHGSSDSEVTRLSSPRAVLKAEPRGSDPIDVISFGLAGLQLRNWFALALDYHAPHDAGHPTAQFQRNGTAHGVFQTRGITRNQFIK